MIAPGMPAAGAIEAATPGSPVDIMLGIGGTPEGRHNVRRGTDSTACAKIIWIPPGSHLACTCCMAEEENKTVEHACSASEDLSGAPGCTTALLVHRVFPAFACHHASVLPLKKMLSNGCGAGVIAAAALKCMGGSLQVTPDPQNLLNP